MKTTQIIAGLVLALTACDPPIEQVQDDVARTAAGMVEGEVGAPTECRTQALAREGDGTNRYVGQVVCETKYDGSQGGIGLVFDDYTLIDVEVVHDGKAVVVQTGNAVESSKKAWDALAPAWSK